MVETPAAASLAMAQIGVAPALENTDDCWFNLKALLPMRELEELKPPELLEAAAAAWEQQRRRRGCVWSFEDTATTGIAQELL